MKEDVLEFRTMEEFMKTCLPELYGRKMVEKMSPREFGEYSAEKVFEKVKYLFPKF